MWKAPSSVLKINLPKSFEMMEDEDVLFLFYEGEVIAAFNAAKTTIEEIKKEIEKQKKE